MERASIYTRISFDPDGTSTSTERQEADCRALCAQHGWQVVEVYTDTDLSAYRTDVARPEYRRLLEDASRGLFEIVVSWKVDRLSRSLVDFTRTLERFDDAGVRLVSVHDTVDTSTPQAKAMTQLLGVFAELESGNISSRVRSYNDHAARQGRPHAGGSRAFGYDRARNIIDDEAQTVRTMAHLYLEGSTFRQIAIRMNNEGVVTTQGNQWSSKTVKQMLTSPGLAGIRSHKGTHYEGSWDPILDLETWGKVQTLAERARDYGTRRNARAHLLVGLIRCSLCGTSLRHFRFRMKNGKSFARYACVKDPGRNNCGKVAVSYTAVESYVCEQVLTLISTSAPLPPQDLGATNSAELLELLKNDSTSLSELVHARFVERSVNASDYTITREALEARITDTENQLRRLQEDQTTLDLPSTYPDLMAWWQGADLQTRRTLLESVLTSITISPARTRGGNKFDSSRVRISWR